MTPTMIVLLFALPTISMAKFYCPRDFPCVCAPSPHLAGQYEIHCSTDETNNSQFNLTIHPPNYVNIECRNSPDWMDFLSSSRLDLGHRTIDRLGLFGCELPNSEYGKTVLSRLDIGRVKLLKVEGLRGNLSRQHFDVFSELRTLVLSNNQLGKVEADLFYGLRNLTKLELHATGIQIPTGFFKESASVLDLDLSGNDLSSLNVGVFEGLQRIRQLNLRQSNLDLIQPKLFGGLSSLRFLDISMNNLRVLPENVLQDLTDLIAVNLSANHFVSIPAYLFYHNRKLKFVQLTHNEVNVTGLPPKLFGDLLDLRVVSLEGMGLRYLPEDLFWGSSNLIELNLNRNDLDMLPSELLKDASELRKLSVSSNNLRALPEGIFVSTNKLFRLDLSKNRIARLESNFSAGLNSLLEINLEENALKFIDVDAFITAKHLKIAKLSHNHLNLQNDFSGDINRISPFHRCGNLEELDLSSNNVADIFDDWIGSHARLRKLDLSYNNFSYVKTENLQFVSNELSVDLSHNNIAIVNISLLESLSELQNNSRDISINLNDNPIECYCEVYSLHRYVAGNMKPRAFEYVKLQVDDLKCTSPKSLQGMGITELNETRLECSIENGRSNSCASGGACDCWLTPASQTLIFDCAAKNLTKAPAWINSWDARYVTLNFTRNALSEAPNMTTNGYDRVQTLDLSENEIAYIDDNLVSPILQVLYLNHNNLTTIDACVVQRLTDSVSSMSLSGNPWLCDDSTMAFREYLQNGKFDIISDHEKVMCADSGDRLWQKPVTIIGVLELIVRGIGALALSMLMFFLFFWACLWCLAGCLRLATSSHDKLYDYDAFVSYRDDDRHFVNDQLVAKLEVGLDPYRLFIRDRHCSPKSYSSKIIERSMKKSNRVVVVLSRDFFNCHWRRLEYQKALDCGSRIVFIVHGDVEDGIGTALKAVMQEHTFIEWGGKRFWEKLLKAMPTPRTSSKKQDFI